MSADRHDVIKFDMELLCVENDSPLNEKLIFPIRRSHTIIEVIRMSKTRSRNKIKKAADKVQLKSKKNSVSEENQNQNHNTQKQALGPNTKR